MKRKVLRGVLSALLAGLGFVTLTGMFGTTREVFECEQAVARLADCCPGFDAHSLRCAGGCGYESAPLLAVAAAECISGATCEDLVASGACGAPTRVVCE